MTLFAFLPALWAALAVGVGAISIPVIIHLINRRRYKIVPWAAMKFLLAAQKQTRKRMRIEQLLLLLVRMAILALCLLAMVSVLPWAEDIWAAMHIKNFGLNKNNRNFRVHHIFVLDASLSMNQKVGKQTAFEIARQNILKKIDDNPSGDGYSILVLKDNPTWLVGEASHNVRKVKTAIEDVKPSHGNSSLASALNMIVSKLNEAKPRFLGGAQAVYFFTDMQKATWMGAAPSEAKTESEKEKAAYLEIQQRATTIFVDCGAEEVASNLAVMRVEFDVSAKPWLSAGDNLTVLATVKNFGTEEKRVRPELLIGKAKAASSDAPLSLRVNKEVEAEKIAPNTERIFTFKDVKFDKPGTYAVQVKLPEDGLEADNARTIILTVRETIPVLLVNGKPTAPPFEKATDYLRFVLNPFAPGEEEKWMPLRPEVVAPGRFAQMSDADLEKYDCIYWCDVEQFGAPEVAKVDAHVRRGGGFIVSLGENAFKQMNKYNELLNREHQGLLPGRLLKRIKAPPDHHFYLTPEDDTAFASDPLKDFKDDKDQLTLRNARFSYYVQAEVPEGKARTVLNFETLRLETAKISDEPLPVRSPAIVEWNPPLAAAQQPAPMALKPGQRSERQQARYRGRVIMLTTTLNMDWNSWPASPSYGAMMHELTRFAVAGRLREQSQSVGGILEAYLPGAKEASVTVHYPAELDRRTKSEKTQRIDDLNLARFADTDFSGVYRFETPEGYELPFAVNPPSATQDLKSSESDLSRLDAATLKALYPQWKIQVVKDARHAMLSDAPVDNPDVEVALPVGPNIANGALLLVLGLLFLEIVLAWYFGHYTTTEGALTNAPAGQASMLVAGVIAVFSTILFAIGTLVIAHEIFTGDFLGFLPEILRTWFERVVGVSDVQAGEGTRWQYEKQGWLFGLPGNESWYAALFSIAAVVTIFLTYKAEAPRVSRFYKFLLGALRLYLILFTVWFLLPRPELHYDREGFPDVVILIDDTRSMGEPDTFHDKNVAERVRKLSEGIKEKMIQEIPGKLEALKSEIEAKAPTANADADSKLEFDGLMQRKAYWEKQRDIINTDKWRPSRLQLVQAILAQPEPHWLKTLLGRERSKVHIFHLDAHGRAKRLSHPKGDAADLIDVHDTAQIERSLEAIHLLEPHGQDSRLGVAVKQVIDHYNGANLSSVIMFTDGVTTRDEPLSVAADYAASKGVALFFVGVGDDNEAKDLRLLNLSCEDQIYLGDRAVFELQIASKGFKDASVPVILRLRDPKTGKEFEVDRANVKLDASGKKIQVRLGHTPKEKGRMKYSIEVEPPKLEPNEKPIPPQYLRLERTIEVIDTKQIKVLYVEGQPRYEFRYLKFLLEREGADEKEKDAAKKKKSIELKVLLLDADDDWPPHDKTALSIFPPTLKDLNEYDVLILGDCDPGDKRLKGSLKDIRAFVRGEKEDRTKADKPGGGILFLAGASHNPHKYLGTPLADIMPVEPLQPHMPTEIPRTEKLRPELTPMGRMHPIFRFSLNEADSKSIWDRLEPMYWYSSGYQKKPAAEVLVYHPNVDAVGMADKQIPKHPLVVQQHVGGRSMFFGFDETWRWRHREHEAKFNTFWIQTMRYLSRGRSTKTELRLDKQVPYLVGEPIKVEVRFPESTPDGAVTPKGDEKLDVKVMVEYHPPGAKPGETPPPVPMSLVKREGSWNQYEGKWERTREGKYTFRLTTPDVSASQPDGQKPSAEATVELPPGELENLRMDKYEMGSAAEKTRGGFYTVDKAEEVLNNLPPRPIVIVVGNSPPTLLWNQWWVFAVIVLVITSEWILRKMKHLL